MSKTKLLYILPSLDAGGAQKVSIHLLKHLDRTKFSIELLLLLGGDWEFSNQLPADITVIQKSHKRLATSLPSIFSIVRRRQPNIVFSTLGPLNILIALIIPFLPKRTKFIARESSILSSRNHDERYPALLNALYKALYNNFDMIVCQSNYMMSDLERNYRVERKKLTVINNPVNTSEISCEREVAKSDNVRLISIGRLAPEKGYDRLLDAFSRLNRREFTLTILGVGPLKEELQTLITRYRLDDMVTLLGYRDNPSDFLQKSDCLVLTSRYEGFPNVVLEANACGVPVVAFNCPGGTSEIIIDGFNGWLIEDGNIEALTNAIKAKLYLSVDKAEIKKFIDDNYSLKKIIATYEHVIEDVLNTNKNSDRDAS